MNPRSVALGALLLGLSVATATITSAQGAPPTMPSVIEWPAPVVGPGLLTRMVIPFDGGLVAVGSEQDGVTSRAAAWWSADGTGWERTILDGPKRGYTEMRDVVAIPGGLVTMGPRGLEHCTGSGEGGVRCQPTPIAVWRSVEGRTWERVDTHGAIGRGAVVALAAGPLGVLAVGVDRQGVAATWRSNDGVAWEAASLIGDGFERARVHDVAVTPDGWVMVGSTGGHDVPAGGVATPNGSTGAAWTSPDGISWRPAAVDGTGEQVELRSVLVGSDGLTAVGSLMGGQQATMWTSVDGTTWTLRDPGPDGTNPPIPSASDGRTIIAMSYRFDDAGGIDWWASTDGVTWTELASSGEVATTPRWGDADGVGLVDGTLVVLGQAGEDELVWLAQPGQGPVPSPASSPAPGPSASPGPSAAALLRPAPSPPVGRPWVRTLDRGARQQLREVVAWKGGFVASGNLLLWRPPGVGRQTIWTSPDGLAWTEVRHPFGRKRSPLVQRLVPFGDVLVAVGSQGRRLVVWTSRDGRRWRRVPDSPVLGSGGVPSHQGYALAISGAAATPGRIEIVGTYWLVSGPTYTRIWTSTDGRQWQRDTWTGADPTNLTDLSGSTDRFTALVGQRDAETGDWIRLAATSPDGLAWTVLGPAPTEHADRIAWSPEHAAYLVGGGQALDDVGSEAPSVWSSADGDAWTLRAQGPPAGQRFGETSVLVEGSTVLLSGIANGQPPDDDPWAWTMTSTDLSTWELSAGWPDLDPRSGEMASFAMAGDRIVAVGERPDDDTHIRAAAWVQGASGEVVAAARTWGPLAVVDDPAIGGLDAGNGPGRLVITDRCVYLKGSRGDGDTLVFRSGQTRWDAKRRQIVYQDRDLGEIRLSNGDRLMLGGYGIGSAASPDNVEVPIGPWIKEPDASCPANRWVVEQVVPRGR